MYIPTASGGIMTAPHLARSAAARALSTPSVIEAGVPSGLIMCTMCFRPLADSRPEEVTATFSCSWPENTNLCTYSIYFYIQDEHITHLKYTSNMWSGVRIGRSTRKCTHVRTHRSYGSLRSPCLRQPAGPPRAACSRATRPLDAQWQARRAHCNAGAARRHALSLLEVLSRSELQNRSTIECKYE